MELEMNLSAFPICLQGHCASPAKYAITVYATACLLHAACCIERQLTFLLHKLANETDSESKREKDREGRRESAAEAAYNCNLHLPHARVAQTDPCLRLQHEYTHGIISVQCT